MTTVYFRTTVIGEYPRETLIEVPLAIPAKIFTPLKMQIATTHPEIVMPELAYVARLCAKPNTATEGTFNLSCVAYIHDHRITASYPTYTVTA
jgi:hypothetical protein